MASLHLLQLMVGVVVNVVLGRVHGENMTHELAPFGEVVGLVIKFKIDVVVDVELVDGRDGGGRKRSIRERWARGER